MTGEYTGLTSAEAQNRLLKYGKNTLDNHKKKSKILLFLGQFTDVMTIILLACTVLSAFMGDWIEAVVMIGIVVINAFLGFIQEFRTERTIEALRGMTALKASVLRDGTKTEIASERIVPGDIVFVSTGDKVPADGFLIQATGLHVDESMLTGESVAVYKEEGSLYAGTLVVSGHAVFGVTDTGMSTEMGRISGMIQNVEEEETPLQKRLAKMGKFIVLGCFVICLLVTVIGLFKGEPVMEMLLAGISLAVAAVPEGLPAIVTISLAMGVQQMAAQNALVRRLPAVETLGSTNVICSDKTGTLTQNRMTVRRVATWHEIVGESAQKADVQRLLDVCRFCNNSADATEVALLELAKEGNASSQDWADAFVRLGELPFDSARKCMSVVVKDRSGAKYLFTKGAPDVLLTKCSAYQSGGEKKPLTALAKRKIMLYNNYLAQDALRVISVAWRRLTDGEAANIQEKQEKDLIFLGLVGLIDPPRPEVPDAVAMCTRAGIRTVMITGDHKVTASVIAKELNILRKGDRVITGEEIERMSDEELCQAAETASVYARVMPVHKLRIVKALKKMGNTVAMTGDGVNDAPAVKEADIGIAMGKNGTDVTREASAMILMDDNFATIAQAVKQGRAIYSNIRKFIRYMLACNLGEVMTMLGGVLLGVPLPLYPIQILWVNLATDGLPGIALGLDPPEQNLMERPPIAATAGIFNGRMLWNILFRGILTGASTLGVFLTVQMTTGQLELARTSAFVTLVMVQLLHSFECRSEDKNLFQIDLRENLWLIGADAVSILMILAVVYIPHLQSIFRTVPLDLAQWGIILAFTLLGPILASLIPGPGRRKKENEFYRKSKRASAVTERIPS